MSEDTLNRINLFEGVVFGVYGGWLISFIDKISFLKFPLYYNIFSWAFQFACVVFSFLCLFLLFAFSIFRANLLSFGLGYVLYLGHEVGILGALYAEGLTVSNLAFFFLGLFLFGLIFVIESRRVGIQRKRVKKYDFTVGDDI